MTSGSFLEAKIAKLDDLIKSNEKLDKFLTPIEEKTKVKKAYLVILATTSVFLGLASGHAGQLICNAIGIVYPSYASIKAIGKL